MISAHPDQLHIYDPPTNSDIVVNLSKAPLNLSVSPDGTHAAVMHDSLVSYVNLSTARVEKTFAVAANTGAVTLSKDYIYVMPTYEGNIYSLQISTGLVSGGSAPFYYASQGKFNSYANAVYSTQDGLSPNDLLKYDASGGVLKNSTNSPYWSDFPVCGPVWFSPDERTIYTACGGVFRASTDSTVDRTYKTSFPGLNGIEYLDTSSTLNRVAVIPSASQFSYPSPVQKDNEVRLFEADYLAQVGRFVIPDFINGGKSFQAHAKAVFFNQSSSALYVVAEADNTSGLLNDFAVQTIALSNPNACGAYFGDSSATAIAPGELKTIQINAEADCVFSVQSQASWLIPVSGQYGSGNTTLTYIVRPNPGAQSRLGTFSIGNTKLTVTQSGAASPSDFNRLSFHVSVADYSKALNKLVLASANPNEIHIYDPASKADRIVPLVREPVSLSVGPDGMHAVVGHDGSVSYVNLQTGTVEKVLPISQRSYGISLAGNGYVYAFAANETTKMVSLDLATGNATPTSATYDGNMPRLAPEGNSLYVAGFSRISKWDITNGAAKITGNNFLTESSSCGNLWFAEDGNRLFTACATAYRTSEVPSDDLTPNGKLSNAEALTWAANSSARGITAVIPAKNFSLSGVDDIVLQAYEDADLTLLSQIALPQFTVNGSPYAGHGRFVFWNSSGSTLFAVMQADTKANLASDYAVYTIKSLPPLTGCSVSVTPESFQSPASGTGRSIDITTGPLCPWSVHSNASWLFLSGATSGNGSAEVSFSVGYNSGPARTGTISINDRTITVTQDGIGTDPGPTPPPTSLDFGYQAIGTKSYARFISLSDSYAPFQISDIAITPNSGEFALQPGGCQSNQRYNACSISVVFAPKAFGKRTASLTFNINGARETVALSGLSDNQPGPQQSVFEIRNRLSGKVLDVTNFSTQPGTRIQQWDAAGSDNQKWLVIPQTDGYYKIQNQLTGQVLDVRNFSAENGAAIQQWDDAGSDNQRWSIIPVDDQYYEIVNKLSGKALDVTDFSVDNGAPIQQWQYGATKNQQWEFVPIANDGTTQSSTLPTGYVTIVNRNSGKVLDVTKFSKSDGTAIQQWTYAATENQQWQLAPVTNGYYKIVNKLSGKVLDVRNFSTENGAAIQQWTYEQSDNQLWKISPVDGEYFKIVNKLSGRVLDMTDFSTENGGGLQQWDDEGSQNQEWSFLPVSN
jgi:hypothetical protein